MWTTAVTSMFCSKDSCCPEIWPNLSLCPGRIWNSY